MKLKIVVNGFYRTRHTAYQAERLCEEGIACGFRSSIVPNDAPDAFERARDADAVIFLDKDVALADRLAGAGVAVFNPPRAVAIADDKALTFNALEKAGIATPETLSAPVIYSGSVGREFVRKAGERLGYPLIVKARHGSLGEQVFKADDGEAAESIARAFGSTPHLYQKYVAASSGRSLRLYVVGDRVEGAMRLSNMSDFRSNAYQHGSAAPVEPTAEQTDLAVRAARAVGAVFAGVDLFDVDPPSVIEVNSNAYFEAIERASGQNIARAIIHYISDHIGSIPYDKESL